MSLTERIKETIIKDILHRDFLLLEPYDEKERDFIKGLLASGVLKESEIDAALEEVVVLRAVGDYQLLLHRQLLGETCYPDHAIIPKFLAYAIKHNKLPAPLDANRIKFDHGQNPDIFAKHYCPDNLIARLREDLLNPKPIPAGGGFYDPHPVCPDCH